MNVLQSWMDKVPMKMQATLLLGLRGPDTHVCPNVKMITRWLRGLVFRPEDPYNVHAFMGSRPERIDEKGPIVKELEFCTQHYYSHLMHALEVVGYCYPSESDSRHALHLFQDMCELMHLSPEPRAEFQERLHDLEWPGGAQPDNFKEAMELIA